jgi:SAM-dependent methyltransferase
LSDHYADGTYLWWHLSRPSPELVAALGDGWLSDAGRVLDTGCGLGSEASHLASAGWRAAGIDLSGTALRRAAAEHGDVAFARADVRALPFAPGCFNAAVDRGCFHYLPAADRPSYSRELHRVLRPGGKLLLRASLRAAGVRNDIDEHVIAATFAGWTIENMERAAVPSDSRTLEVIVARLISQPQTPYVGRMSEIPPSEEPEEAAAEEDAEAEIDAQAEVDAEAEAQLDPEAEGEL